MCVAPNSCAAASLRSSMSIPMISSPRRRVAAPAIAASPTPPHPNTATDWPTGHGGGVDRRPEPGHHAAPEQPGNLRRRRGVDLRALSSVDERVRKGADAQGGDSSVPFSQRHLVVGVGGVEDPRPAVMQQDRTAAAHGTPVGITKSPGATSLIPSPTSSTMRQPHDPRGTGSRRRRRPRGSAGRCDTPTRMATIASLGPGSGTTIDSMATGSPLALATTPRTVCGMRPNPAGTDPVEKSRQNVLTSARSAGTSATTDDDQNRRSSSGAIPRSSS